MAGANTQPPWLAAIDRVVLFDGVCYLCSGWASFLLKYDRRAIFRLASVQSDVGQATLEYFGFPTDAYETMVYVEAGSVFTKSTALLKIVGQLPYPWAALRFLNVVPPSIRDWLYDRVAVNRYTLFGKRRECYVPDPDSAKRFIGDIGC